MTRSTMTTLLSTVSSSPSSSSSSTATVTASSSTPTSAKRRSVRFDTENEYILGPACSETETASDSESRQRASSSPPSPSAHENLRRQRLPSLLQQPIPRRHPRFALGPNPPSVDTALPPSSSVLLPGIKNAAYSLSSPSATHRQHRQPRDHRQSRLQEPYKATSAVPSASQLHGNDLPTLILSRVSAQVCFLNTETPAAHSIAHASTDPGWIRLTWRSPLPVSTAIMHSPAFPVTFEVENIPC